MVPGLFVEVERGLRSIELKNRSVVEGVDRQRNLDLGLIVIRVDVSLGKSLHPFFKINEFGTLGIFEPE